MKEVRNGASFEEVSCQFSSVAASAGGKVETFLDPGRTALISNVAKAVQQTKTGGITDPVRTNEGFTIIKVYDTHSAEGKDAKEEEAPKGIEVNLKEILLKLKPDADNKEADVMLQIGEEVARNPGTCEDKSIANIKDTDDFDIQVDFQRTLLSENCLAGVRTIAG